MTNYFDDFDLQIQCEELPGYEEWLEEVKVAEGYYEQEEP